eukprot:2086100-Rhodomonas_salina.1
MGGGSRLHPPENEGDERQHRPCGCHRGYQSFCSQQSPGQRMDGKHQQKKIARPGMTNTCLEGGERTVERDGAGTCPDRAR